MREFEKEGYTIPKIPIFYIKAENEQIAAKILLQINSKFAKITKKGFQSFLDNFKIDADFLKTISIAEIEGLDFDSLEEEGKTDQDFIPDTPKITKSKKGDIYQLGRHRLLVGDATNSDDFKKLLEDELVDMIWTDPPYNINYELSRKNLQKLENTRKVRGVMNDHMGGSEFYNFLLKSFTNACDFAKKGAPIYIAHSDMERINFEKAMVDSGFLCKQTIIWIKHHFSFGRQDYQWMHEPILYGWKEGASHKWYGDFDKTTVWEPSAMKDLSKKELKEILVNIHKEINTSIVRIDKPLKSDLHPTMKPVDLITRQIQNSSRENDLVLDMFGGSGSTIISCEKINRRCYCLELDEKFADVIVERWEKFSGQKARKL